MTPKAGVMLVENIDIETLKKISYEIIREESKRINQSINSYLVTNKDYYKEYVFKTKKIGQDLFPFIIKPRRTSGFNDQKGNVVIFLDKIKKITSKERQIFFIILCSYHEVKHTEQKILNQYTYERFIYDIESYLIGEKKINYQKNHNKVLFEIDANIYAIEKTKEYLINNYPDVYQKVKEEISTLEQKYYKDLEEYDALTLVEKIIDYMRYQLNIHWALTVNHMEIISPVLELFIYPDVLFKSIKYMRQDGIFNNLDKRIIYLFLSSKQFLEQVNLDNLTKEELVLLDESLEYTNNKYINHPKLKEKNILKENITKLLEYKRHIKIKTK